MTFDLANYPKNIHQSLKSETISLSQRPHVRFGLCGSGLLCCIASDHIYLARPILHELDVKFHLFSQKLSSDNRYTSPYKLIPDLFSRRWKQRAISEVELQPTQTIHQFGLNVQLGKSMIKENDNLGKYFILNSFWSKACIDLEVENLICMITSQNTLLVYNCNSEESGFQPLLLLSQLYYDPLKTNTFQFEPSSPFSWTDTFNKMHNVINFTAIISADFSEIFMPEDGTPYLLLGCGTKDGRLLIWKIDCHCTNYIEHYELLYEIDFLMNPTWINMLSWSNNSVSTNAIIAICSTDGTVDVIILNLVSNQRVTQRIYYEMDGATVKAILWDIGPTKNRKLFLIKGSYLFMFSLAMEYSPVISLASYFLYVDISHTSAVASLNTLSVGYIVVGYVDLEFTIYDHQDSDFKLLTKDSINFSKCIKERFVSLVTTNFLMISFTFSPNNLYIILLCMGPLIGCGRVSKFDISLRNKIFFIPIINIPIIDRIIQPFVSKFIHWDMIKLYLSDKTKQSYHNISTLFLSLSKVMNMKLQYIYDQNCGVDSTSTMLYLLLHFNSDLLFNASCTLNPENEVHNCILQYQQNLLNSSFESINFEKCKVCESDLTFDHSKLYFICDNYHKSEFCILTLKTIYLTNENMHCILCWKKILKNTMKELTSILPKTFSIRCPLCDGLFIDS